MVGGGNGQVGAAHPTACHAEPVKGLGRRDLVDQVQVYVDNPRLSRLFLDHMGIPYLFKHCLRRHRFFLLGAGLTAYGRV